MEGIISYNTINNGLYKKRSQRLIYNYNLYELINNFSFFDFCYEAKELENPMIDDHGAILVITDKQYILGYNALFGTGNHLGSEARIYKELHGGGNITDRKEAEYLGNLCKDNYIIARIVYEACGENENRRPLFDGYIHFYLHRNGVNKSVSPGMYKSFMNFYNEYNEEISFLCRKFSFHVCCEFLVNGREKHIFSYNLDDVYKYLTSIIDENVTCDDSELIIGVPNNVKNKVLLTKKCIK